MKECVTILAIVWLINSSIGCQFYPPGEYLRFVRVPENLKVGEEVLKIEVYPRRNLKLQAVDKNDDVHYFTYKDVNKTTVSLLLARSLDDLVDTESPQNVLKFKLVCDYEDGDDTISSSLSITVYVEDVNDHAPVFLGTPYHVTVDELTPVGLNIFRRIRATDRDKPNTPNSDVQYAITAGNDRGKFALDSSHQAFLLLDKPLDYDVGDREFTITVTASDRGIPPKSSNATIKITIKDADDLSPKFTKGVYRTKITEFFPLTGERIHHRLNFDPPIYAFDQDTAIDTPIRYDILAGNDRHLFYLDHVNGSLFLEREIDLDSERALPGNTFVLQIQASQVDNVLKAGVARVEIEVMDLNDNLPEFEVDFYNISIVENLPNGFSVLQIVATDQDQGDNAEFFYELEDPSGAFAIDSRNGWLMVKEHTILDREKRSKLLMRVDAKEKAPSIVTNTLGMSSVSVEVTLLDSNDNNPLFIPSNVYEFSTYVNGKIGDVFGQVRALDPDLGRNGIVSYSIQKSANNTSAFKVDARTGQIFINEPLKEGKYTLLVEATDQPVNPSERRFSLAVVVIEVKNSRKNVDSSNMEPEFLGAPYEFWVGANVDVGTSVGQIRVTDDSKETFLMYDLLHSYKEGVPFAVEEKSGTITVVHPLSKFARSVYDFEAVVTNIKDMSIVTNVTIHLVNPSDDKIILMKNNEMKPIEFRVKENQAGVLIGKLSYPNTTRNILKFSIANQKDVTDFIGISPDGSLYTQKALDREKRDVYMLTIIVENLSGFVVNTGIHQVTIFVDDENDNAPSFEHPLYFGKIRENSKTGTEVELNYPIMAHDNDIGVNGQITLNVYGEGNEMFRLEKFTGKVYFQSRTWRLDREEKPIYNFQLVAKDKGGLYGEAKLTLKIEDENDNPPIIAQMVITSNKGVQVLEYDESTSNVKLFQEHRINATSGVYTLTQSQVKSQGVQTSQKLPLLSIAEDVSVGTPILKIIAKDLDLDSNAVIKYQLSSETYIPRTLQLVDAYNAVHYFMVHSSTGEIAIARTLPPQSEFRLNITASDKDDLKDNITVRFYVKDVNNHNPVFAKSWYNFDTEESAYSRKYLGKIEATDDDFGQNANISYRIQRRKDEDLPFTIGEFSGLLSTNGELDREKKDKYSLVIVATDNPIRERRLSSSVNVEINVLDVNDNPPIFYGYDEIVSLNIRDFEKHKNHAFAEPIEVPMYYASIAENSPIDTSIIRVFANDSDFTGNGNGLILFSIPQRKNKDNLFTIDSKEGIISTIGKIDFEKQKTYNITVIASDLGSPSLNSIAIVSLSVIDMPEDMKNAEGAIFNHRYYEVEVEENVPVPLNLLTLNVTETYRRYRLRYSIIADKNSEIKKMFKIDPRNGTIFIIDSPDREKQSLYELIVRVDEYKVGRDMTVMVYPVTNDRIAELGLNEVKVIVRITDVNDNVPKFTIVGRPIIAAIPTSANYGYQIIRLKATDSDLGLNGEVRYQILGRAEDESRRFAIDSVTGQVRAIASFSHEAGRVYGFDVKATDRRGADSGKSAIANVFVYVLDDEKQLVMVVGTKPLEVEKNMENILMALYNITGYDVRVRKLETHFDQNHRDSSATDMYLYAVDPVLNMVVPTDKLQKILHSKRADIEKSLDNYKVLAFASGTSERNHSKNQRVLLSTLEIGVVILGSVVFIGALATAICVVCVRRKKKSVVRKNFTHAQSLGYTIAPNGKSVLFPSTFGEGFQYGTEPGRLDLIQQPTGYHHRLDSCSRLSENKSTTRKRSRSAGGLETSITSLHSSGQDSGIVDSSLHCPCGQSTSQSSVESNKSSYEDSLNSENQRKLQETSFNPKSLSSTKALQQRRRSLSDGTGLLQRSAVLSAFPSRSLINPGYMLPGHLPIGRPSDRLFLSQS